MSLNDSQSVRPPIACGAADAALHLGVSEPTIWRMLRDGELPKVKIRGRTMIRYSDLEAFLARAAEDAA